MSQKISFIGKVAKVGERYAIYFPAKLNEVAKQLHQKYVKVIIEPIESE